MTSTPVTTEATAAKRRRTAAFAACTRFLSGHRRLTVRERLTALAASPHADAPADEYGDGDLARTLEKRIAQLLGKEAAVFCAKGMIAQQAALRTWTERSGSPVVIVHPKSHIDGDENAAYERLHNLRPLRLGSDHAPFTAQELDKIAERAGVLTVEVPLRRAGFRLLPWDDFVAIGDWARSRRIPLHLDGARLWECGPYYARPYAEIAAVADSVYVSFYKGLGAIAGCVLAGPADFIAETRPWLERHGSFLFTSFPMIIAALEGLERHLPKMPAYVARAQEIAAALASIPGVKIAPSPPQTNSFQVYLPGTVESWEVATLALAESERLSLFQRFVPTQFADMVMAEVFIGDAAEDLATGEITSMMAALVEGVQAIGRGWHVTKPWIPFSSRSRVTFLVECLEVLAAPPTDQLDHLESLGFVRGHGIDELALDYDGIASAAPDMVEKGEITEEQAEPVLRLNTFLESMSGMENAELWTSDALASSEAWQDVREQAQSILKLFPSVTPKSEQRGGWAVSRVIWAGK
jgi:threonine aldolase